MAILSLYNASMATIEKDIIKSRYFSVIQFGKKWFGDDFQWRVKEKNLDAKVSQCIHEECG